LNVPNFSAEQIELFFLVLLRVSTIVAMIPIIGVRTTPVRVKGGLAIFITVLVFPFVGPPAAGADDLFTLGLRMGGEVLIGIILGFAGVLIFAGIQMAGELVGFQMGFSIINIIDPLTSDQVSIIAEIQYLFAGLLFLGVNGHHVLIQAVSESYTVLPVLGFHMTGAVAQSLVDLSRNMFVIAVKISAPIVVALLFANLGLGLIARTVPQINILIVGFPLQIAIGLIGVGLTIPLFLQISEGLFSNLPAEISLLLRAL
jgi:flagellar biosynthetic protein FliR